MKISQNEIKLDKYPNLSSVFSAYQNMSLGEFSKRLFDKKAVNIESVLLEAFKNEWQASDWDQRTILKAIKQLEELPVIQTSHHITPTNGPTFFSYDIVSLCGLKSDQCYLVGANSGVAFSNPAWTGALSYEELHIQDLLVEGSEAYHMAIKSNKERERHGSSENRYSLIPARQRDQLTYGVEISETIFKKYSQLNTELKERLPKMEVGDSYNRWATKSCEMIQNKILNQSNICYFDINQVITNYLIQILENEDVQHPIYQVFFGEASTRIWSVFNDYPAFLGTYSGKKSNKVEQLYWKESTLVGKKTTYTLTKPEDLLLLLKQQKLCPAIFITFFVLKFINGIRCLGAFNQIEYLENIRKLWIKSELNWNLHLNAETDKMLSTGRIYDSDKPYWPLDMYIKEISVKCRDFSDYPMIKFWQPIINQLIQ